MVDKLEDENSGCFYMLDKTFIDLYMKSGLFITEIVKRLYQSNVMKERFPIKEERLRHIFEKQVTVWHLRRLFIKLRRVIFLGLMRKL